MKELNDGSETVMHQLQVMEAEDVLGKEKKKPHATDKSSAPLMPNGLNGPTGEHAQRLVDLDKRQELEDADIQNSGAKNVQEDLKLTLTLPLALKRKPALSTEDGLNGLNGALAQPLVELVKN